MLGAGPVATPACRRAATTATSSNCVFGKRREERQRRPRAGESSEQRDLSGQQGRIYGWRGEGGVSRYSLPREIRLSCGAARAHGFVARTRRAANEQPIQCRPGEVQAAWAAPGQSSACALVPLIADWSSADRGCTVAAATSQCADADAADARAKAAQQAAVEPLRAPLGRGHPDRAGSPAGRPPRPSWRQDRKCKVEPQHSLVHSARPPRHTSSSSAASVAYSGFI